MRARQNRALTRRVRGHGAVARALMPPPAPPGAPPEGGGDQAPQAGQDPYNYEADPILQRIRGLGTQRVADAESQALAARNQLAIDYGDPSLAQDDATRAAAAANPFSRAALFAKKSVEQPKQLTESENSQNLFYSSDFGKKQSELATALLGEQAGNQAEARGRVGGIEEALRGARSDAANANSSAEEDAAARMQARIGDLPVGGQGTRQIGGRAGGGVHGIAQRLMRPPRHQRTQRPPAHLPGGQPS